MAQLLRNTGGKLEFYAINEVPEFREKIQIIIKKIKISVSYNRLKLGS